MPYIMQKTFEKELRIYIMNIYKYILKIFIYFLMAVYEIINRILYILNSDANCRSLLDLKLNLYNNFPLLSSNSFDLIVFNN